MRSKFLFLRFVAVALLSVGASPVTASGADQTPRMTKEALKGRLGDPEVIVVDVRTEGSWADSATKIQGAVREDPAGLRNWVLKYPKDKTLVFYCS